MTTYQSNQATAHAFANKISNFGKNSNGSLNFRENIIYSYSTPMAEFVAENTILFNIEKYSVTTSTHQSIIRDALPYYYDIIEIPYNNSHSSNNLSQLQNYSWVFESFENSLIFFFKKLQKAKSKKDDYLQEIEIIKANIQKYYNLFASQIDKRKLTKTIKNILDNQFSNEALQHIEAQRAKAEKLKIKRDEAKRKKQIQQAITDFFSHKSNSIPCQKIYLRFSKSKQWVETSHRAKVPLKIALGLFDLAQKSKKSQKKLNISAMSSEQRQIHDFTLDKIDEKGNATVGCHFLEFSEMKRLYNEFLRLKQS